MMASFLLGIGCGLVAKLLFDMTQMQDFEPTYCIQAGKVSFKEFERPRGENLNYYLNKRGNNYKKQSS